MKSKDWEKNLEEKPEKTIVRALLWIVGIFFFLGIIITPVCYVAGWVGEAAQVAREEGGPRELLRKYEWFKDAAAQVRELRKLHHERES